MARSMSIMRSRLRLDSRGKDNGENCDLEEKN